MITCKLCLETKEEGCFNANSRKSNGKNSYCKACQSKKNKLWRQENADVRASYEKEYKKTHKEKLKVVKHRWDSENTSHRKAYRELHKSRYAAHAMRRYVRVKLCQPTWLSECQIKVIEDFYWLAKDIRTVTGESYHVDHIVPLQGKNFCGLHVPWNLQILPASVNISKSNRLEGESDG
jgi:hypothetical protein